MISVITNIGYDHVDILGNSIEKITEHKAGIIKQNGDTVCVRQENITEIIEEKCKIQNSNIYIIEKDDFTNYIGNMELQKFDYKEYKEIEINLKGKVQIYNAQEVLECFDILKSNGYKITDKAIYDGLKTVVHKARLETLSTEPLIIFDGGHNENAINNLKENVNQYFKDMKKVYIVSILKTKDYKTIVKKLCEDKDAKIFFTSGNDKKRYVSKDRLYKEAQIYLDDINMYKEELPVAIDICKKLYNDHAILIVGSFYVYKTVCEVLNNDKNK